MQVLCTIPELRNCLNESRLAGSRIGLVPTMGALHEGHLSLVRRALELADVVVVSIFVNPIQFAPSEDLDVYPRDIERDCALCEELGVDVVFCPTVDGMYPGNNTVCVVEEELSQGLCGSSRPGHFSGVLTVVATLFNLVQPNVAVFGQKDAQQGRLIEQRAADLNFPVSIDIAPTVREPDGLAMSSRNSYLSPSERRDAPCVYEGLRCAEEACVAGERDAAKLRQFVEASIGKSGSAQIEYVEVVDYATLRPVSSIAGATLIAVAVRFGKTRLIDNTILLPDGPG